MRKISIHEHFVLHSRQAVANRPICQIAASLAEKGLGDDNEKAGLHRLNGRWIIVAYLIDILL